ncbi:MAG TPA: hydroxymethylglutaryl-CoA lyase [Dehalococcoidia bacterium]|nr:hydroxymethylglutaryl-CoA lyase [Dehalococcoidia bacterium]
MRFPERVTITEVGPRDGLQNEAETIPLERKIALVDRLSETGLTRIEAASFVSPKAIPQMENASEVMAGIDRRPGVTYIGLVPNETGARNAIEAKVDEIAVVVSASESHNKANINRTVAETMEIIANVAELAAEVSVPWSGYVSTAFGCPYEGEVKADRVLALASRLRGLGAWEISLGDTIGIANPRQAFAMVKRFFAEVPQTPLRLHFHDTRGMALANVVAAMEAGAEQFDGSIGGLGGCPYAPGASGNVATEDLAYMLAAMGIETGIDLDSLIEVASLAEEIVGRRLEGRVKRTVGGV